MSEEIDVKRYLLELSNGEALQIDIPENWKVTYGPVTPGSRSSYDNDRALRIYESDTKQRAIFTGVKSFRDLSIPVLRRLVRVEGSSSWEESESGGSSSTAHSREFEWVKEEV